MSSQPHAQQIQDDENDTQHKYNSHKIKGYEHEDSDKKQQNDPDKNIHIQKNKLDLDHQSINKFANFTLDIENDQKNQIFLRVVGNQTIGSTFMKYTAYLIKGHDKKGQVNIKRRFNQFHQLRTAMVQRWPGCFVPSIPSKNILHKNDPEITVHRERYLNNFVMKMTKLPHLYNSQEFQFFLHSKDADVSKAYSSWSHPTYDDIINKYRQCFSNLKGKKIDTNVNSVIAQFYARIKKNQILLQRYRGFAKSLALSKDTMNLHYPSLFTKIIPTYQKQILSQYIDGKQQCYVYQNTQQVKLTQHVQIIKSSTSINPYWQLYDLIKNQQRDGRAFLQAFASRQKYQNSKLDIDNKVRDNQKAILQILQGKTNLKSLTSSGTKQQVKYKLQIQNTQLAKQKQSLLTLSDIILAIIVYIEIPAYQNAKANFYIKTLKKIGGIELNSVQVDGDIWKDVLKSSTRIRDGHYKIREHTQPQNIQQQQPQSTEHQ